jgi:short-subunit dehydrogenase
MKNNVLVISGATSSFGSEVVKELSKKNYDLILLSKSRKKLMDLCEIVSKNNSINIIPIIMDFYKASNEDYMHLKNFLEDKVTQIDNFISFTSHFDKIQPILSISQESFIKTFQINFFSQIQLISSLKSLLQKSQKKPSVIFTLESNSLSDNSYYGSFGLSMQLLSKTINILNSENKRISFFGVIPGPVKSNIRKKMFPGEDLASKPQNSLVKLYNNIISDGNFQDNSHIIF